MRCFIDRCFIHQLIAVDPLIGSLTQHLQYISATAGILVHIPDENLTK